MEIKTAKLDIAEGVTILGLVIIAIVDLFAFENSQIALAIGSGLIGYLTKSSHDG